MLIRACSFWRPAEAAPSHIASFLLCFCCCCLAMRVRDVPKRSLFLDPRQLSLNACVLFVTSLLLNTQHISCNLRKFWGLNYMANKMALAKSSLTPHVDSLLTVSLLHLPLGPFLGCLFSPCHKATVAQCYSSELGKVKAFMSGLHRWPWKFLVPQIPAKKTYNFPTWVSRPRRISSERLAGYEICVLPY